MSIENKTYLDRIYKMVEIGDIQLDLMNLKLVVLLRKEKFIINISEAREYLKHLILKDNEYNRWLLNEKIQSIKEDWDLSNSKNQIDKDRLLQIRGRVLKKKS